MKFCFETNARPRHVARLLKEKLEEFGFPIAISEARNATARLYGYCDWNELDGAIGDRPSLDDRCVVPGIVADRRALQVFVLGELLQDRGLDEVDARSYAMTLVDWLRPTDEPKVGAPAWLAFHGGWIAEDDNIVYWVVPGGDLIFDVATIRAANLRHGVPLQPASFTVSLGAADTPGEAKDKVEAMIGERRRHEAEKKLLGRAVAAFDPDDFELTPWGELHPEEHEVVRYGEGLEAIRVIGEETQGGFRVAADLVAAMHPVLKTEIEHGFGWYSFEETAFVALGLPRFFTAVEQEHAREHVAAAAPEILEILDGRMQATEENLRHARRGFREELIEWDILGIGRPDEDGLVPVEARMSVYFGPRREDRALDFQTIQTFLVPEQELRREGFQLDPERHIALPDLARRPGDQRRTLH